MRIQTGNYQLKLLHYFIFASLLKTNAVTKTLLKTIQFKKNEKQSTTDRALRCKS